MALVQFLRKNRIMLKHSMKSLALGAALSLTAGGTWAQTAATPATNIGVTPQNAQEAMQKAAPQPNTGTLVRTEPSAATQAGEAANNVGNTVTPNTRATAPAAGSTAARTDATGNTSATGTTNNTNMPGTSMGSGAGSNAATSANDNSTVVSGNTNRNARPLRADRN